MKDSKLRESLPEHSTKVQAEPVSNLVKASIPAGYNTSINIRLVPGRDFGDLVAIPKTCKPRKGRKPSKRDLLSLPDTLVAKLVESDKQMITWLAQDEANTRLFLSNPTLALEKAGINLTRAERKQLHRTHQEVSQGTVIGPGVKVADIGTAVYPDGRIGKIRPDKTTGDDSNSCVKEV